MSNPDYVYVIYIESTPEKVWTALTDGEITKDYWGRHSNRSDWRPGSEWRHVNYDAPDEVAVIGEVIASEPPHRLVLSWAHPDQRGNAAKVSRVAFAIEEFMGSVRLTVTHTDLDDATLRSISMGWPPILSSLKSLLETGASLPMTRRHWKDPR